MLSPSFTASAAAALHFPSPLANSDQQEKKWLLFFPSNSFPRQKKSFVEINHEFMEQGRCNGISIPRSKTHAGFSAKQEIRDTSAETVAGVGAAAHTREQILTALALPFHIVILMPRQQGQNQERRGKPSTKVEQLVVVCGSRGCCLGVPFHCVGNSGNMQAMHNLLLLLCSRTRE